MKRLKTNRGESILEALVSIMIISLCFTILTTAIVTAAKINKKYSEEDKQLTFTYNGDEQSAYTIVCYKATITTITENAGTKIKVTRGDQKKQLQYDASREGLNSSKPVELYETPNGYVYYEKAG